jgi:hypothetical protein
MSKAGNWVPIDKGLVKYLPKIDRPYSPIEAMFSYTCDVNCKRDWSINGYAALWQWNRKKVARFIKECGTDTGHIPDKKGTQTGQAIHFIDEALWGERGRNGTGMGQERDRNGDTTINPNPKPKPKKKTVRFTPPSLSEVKDYCLERNNKIDPEGFIDFYESKGWMVGKNKMKDWKAAIRTWEKKDNGNGKKRNGRGNGYTEARRTGETNWLGDEKL